MEKKQTNLNLEVSPLSPIMSNGTKILNSLKQKLCKKRGDKMSSTRVDIKLSKGWVELLDKVDKFVNGSRVTEKDVDVVKNCIFWTFHTMNHKYEKLGNKTIIDCFIDEMGFKSRDEVCTHFFTTLTNFLRNDMFCELCEKSYQEGQKRQNHKK